MAKKFVRIVRLIVLAFLCIICVGGFGCEIQAAQTEPFAFTKKVTTLTAGKSCQMKVNRTSGVTWSVGNEKIATVDENGKVRAHRYGKTHVYAVCEGKKIKVLLQVNGKKVVGLDPGHQSSGDSSTEPNGPGSTTYKAKVAGGTRGTASGKPEYQLTLEIAKKLKKELWDRGYQVVLTRTKNDVNISNKERALLMNDSGVDFCIRIHADGATASARGATVLCPSSNNRYIAHLSEESKKLSKALIDGYCNQTKLRNRGISYRDDLTGTNWSTVPTTLIELGFMTNATEDRFMASKEGQQKMVLGLANGVDDYCISK